MHKAGKIQHHFLIEAGALRLQVLSEESQSSPGEMHLDLVSELYNFVGAGGITSLDQDQSDAIEQHAGPSSKQI